MNIELSMSNIAEWDAQPKSMEIMTSAKSYLIVSLFDEVEIYNRKVRT